MTRRPQYPPVDARRVSELRQALLRDIGSLAPLWRGAQETQGPDRAIVEIAARLTEEATKRLDKTPERDALVFLEMFDIAPPRPSAAEGVSIFVLKKDKTAPVLADEGTGIEIDTSEGEKVNFETAEDLRIQAAQIDLLATVDPAADKLELAPNQVTSVEPDLIRRPRYTLATTAAPEDTVVSITPPVGILPDDLLRVTVSGSDPMFLNVAEFSEDGLATLKAPVGGAGLQAEQVTAIERITRLDAFEMPNRQEHGLYIGDKDVLNVNEPAEIRLRFKPGPIAEILSPNAVEFEIWGTREGPGDPEDAPRWHRLAPLVDAGSDLRLYKAWIGPVDELKLGEKKSRWIRIRPLGNITPNEDGGHLLTARDAMLEQVRMGIQTEQPKDASGNTISQAAYNGAPLPLTTSFLPFGSEPQRFDTFALAAPEAFTKPEAHARLDFTLMDATLGAVAIALRPDAERHAYGIGLNGRLQVLDVTGGRNLWQEVKGPPKEPGSEETLRLDLDAGLTAFGFFETIDNKNYAKDIVVAQTAERTIAATSVLVSPADQGGASGPITVNDWHTLPGLPDGALGENEHPTLMVVPVVLNPSTGAVYGLLLAAASGGVFRILLSNNGTPLSQTWISVSAPGAPQLPQRPHLKFIDGSVDTFVVTTKGSFLAVDREGALWVLEMRLNGDSPAWHALKGSDEQPIRVSPRLEPAAIIAGPQENRRLIVTGLPLGGTKLHLWDCGVLADGFEPSDPQKEKSVSDGAINDVAEVKLVPGLVAGEPNAAHVVGYTNGPEGGKVFEWSPGTAEESVKAMPTDLSFNALPGRSVAAAFLPNDSDPRAMIIFGVEHQNVVRLSPLRSTTPREVRDWVVAPFVPADDGTNFGVVLIERQLTTGSVLISTPEDAVGQNEDREDVLPFGTGDTDWSEDVIVYRATTNGQDVTYDETSPGHLPDPTGADPDTLVGSIVAVRHTNEPEPATFAILTITGNDGNALTVDDPDSLKAFLAGDARATWHLTHEVDKILGATGSRPNAQTLLRLDPAPTEKDRLASFSAPQFAVQAEALTGTGGENWFIAEDWQGSPPVVDGLVKIVAEDQALETLEVRSFQSFNAPNLSWEYFNGEGWKRLVECFEDTTNNFARSGWVAFRIPRNLAKTEIGGQEDHWIRARLVGGDYGKPVYKVIESPGEQKVVVDTSDLRAPEVARVTAQFKLEPNHLPKYVVAKNNLRDLDQSSANRLAGVSFAMFEGAYAAPLGDGGGRAIMLGMKRPLEPGSANLFVQVYEQDREAKLILETLGPDNSWGPAPLSDEDPTVGLHRTGRIKFNISERPAQVQLFGKALHWLRMRVEGTSDWKPQITGLWLNGVRIVQAETVRQELLASSAGEPELKLTLSKPPVLADSLELRVREHLSDEEIDALNDTRKEGAPQPVLKDPPNLPGKWVLWTRVDNLQDQAGNARVYLLNPDGRLRFGDGQKGRIVPAGRDNIRAFSYQSGGQRVETAAFAEAGLRGSVEGVEMVLAPAPIAGGTHAPTPQDLVARMPEAMRHAGHGLSLIDLEALARDADSEIVQVRALAPETPGGTVRLIVLARGASRTPEYSLASQDNLRRELQTKMSDAYGPACLEVRSAEFVKVKVTVSLVARAGALAALESDAGARLRDFLYAAKGGPDWTGWPPGRAVWPTDIRRALSTLEALDRVLHVEIVMPGGRSLGDVRQDEVVTTETPSDVTILVEEEAAA